jgi:glutaredoxin
MIKIYGKPGCGKCNAAKEKLKLLGLEFKSCNLSDFVVWHENWRNDESVAVLAFYSEHNHQIPIISVDGKLYLYSEAMKVLKGNR